MSGIGLLHDCLALLLDRHSLSGMHSGWREQADAGVVMLMVVPGEEGLEPLTSRGQRTEFTRKSSAVLECLELRL